MKMKKLQSLMKQAQQMQEQLEAEMNQMRFHASSGGGVVEVEMDGKKNLLSVKIDPEAVDPEDVDILQDMIVAAVNEASKQVDDKLASQVGGLAGGLAGGLLG
jgi:DNA-binding YbaB/EbfC family protein